MRHDSSAAPRPLAPAAARPAPAVHWKEREGAREGGREERWPLEDIRTAGSPAAAAALLLVRKRPRQGSPRRMPQTDPAYSAPAPPPPPCGERAATGLGESAGERLGALCSAHSGGPRCSPGRARPSRAPPERADQTAEDGAGGVGTERPLVRSREVLPRTLRPVAGRGAERLPEDGRRGCGPGAAAERLLKRAPPTGKVRLYFGPGAWPTNEAFLLPRAPLLPRGASPSVPSSPGPRPSEAQRPSNAI